MWQGQMEIQFKEVFMPRIDREATSEDASEVEGVPGFLIALEEWQMTKVVGPKEKKKEQEMKGALEDEVEDLEAGIRVEWDLEVVHLEEWAWEECHPSEEVTDRRFPRHLAISETTLFLDIMEWCHQGERSRLEVGSEDQCLLRLRQEECSEAVQDVEDSFAVHRPHHPSLKDHRHSTLVRHRQEAFHAVEEEDVDSAVDEDFDEDNLVQMGLLKPKTSSKF